MGLPTVKYSSSSITLSDKEYSYRPMTHEEQKTIFQAKDLATQKDMFHNIVKVVNACVQTKPFDAGKLEIVDFIILLTAIRMNSKDDIIPVSVNCEHCNATNNTKVHLKDIKTSKSEMDNKIQADDTIVLQMRKILVEDFIKLSVGGEDEVELFKHIVEFVIDGDDVHDLADYTNEEVYLFMSTLPQEVTEQIQKYVKDMPTAYVETKFTCTGCDKVNEKKLTDLTI